MLKDVRLCLQEAKALGVPTDMMGMVASLWERTASEMGADKDFTTIVKTVENRAGVIVGKPK